VQLSMRDPFYVQIESALADGPIDTDLFERLAAELVESKGIPTSLAVGGADNGYDFELIDNALEPGPGVATTGDRVTTNLKRNLDRNTANCPQAAKKTYVVTSSVLTSRKRDNLKRAARERGYVYRGASDRSDVARYIYANPPWARDLLGLDGQASPLSAVPLTSRLLVEVPLVGRREAEGRIRAAEGDLMLVGSPGSGKTAVLSGLVSEGMASFMVSTDMAAVANAIRQQAPTWVIIDDLEDVPAATRELIRLRTEVGGSFRIIVTDWERNVGLEQAMGLAATDVVELQQLTRDEIVGVVESVGIAGPSALVREIVDQSEGVPGLAVTLAQVALAGEYRDLFDGNRLGALMESAVSRLLGGPAEGGHAGLILGAIALAGDPGLTLEEVADYASVSPADVQRILRRLTSGGIIHSQTGRVSLRPHALRGYMIRKAFFDVSPANYEPLVEVVPDRGEMAKELVLASRAGAAVPDLLPLVLDSGSALAVRYFAGTGEREARELLSADPGLAIHVAAEALHTAPQVVIPLLLELAVEDARELHNTPEQPIRMIKDWANTRVPGRDDVVARKRIVVKSALEWVKQGGDFTTACRAFAEVFRTVLEGSETDPGAGMTFTITRELLTYGEIDELAEVWRTIRAAIEANGEAHWPSMLSACFELIHPDVFGESPAVDFDRSRSLGETVIGDIGDLARAHPGVLDGLNTMRRQLGHNQLYSIPDDYAVLFGEHERSDWRRHEEERTRQIEDLADSWSTGDPDEIAARLKWLRDEAAVAGKSGDDRSPNLCHLLAQRVDDVTRWLTALAAAGVEPACLVPFLRKAVVVSVGEWESVALSILEDPALESAVVEVALSVTRLSNEMWTALSGRLANHTQLVGILCSRRQVLEPTLRRLLTHDSTSVAHAAAVGMWTGKTHGDIPAGLRREWEEAVVRMNDDEYWLEEILASSPTLAARWLETRIADDDWLAMCSQNNIESACGGLDSAQRLELLRSLPEHFYADNVVAALIGDSDRLYREVLRDVALGEYWRDSLRRATGDVWRRRAGIALEEGKAPREVASVSLYRSEGWSGPRSQHLQGKIDEYSMWLDDPVADVREVAQQIIDLLSADREQALAKERREAIEGFS